MLGTTWIVICKHKHKICDIKSKFSQGKIFSRKSNFLFVFFFFSFALPFNYKTRGNFLYRKRKKKKKTREVKIKWHTVILYCFTQAKCILFIITYTSIHEAARKRIYRAGSTALWNIRTSRINTTNRDENNDIRVEWRRKS